MTDKDFMAAIIANSDEDAPRLIYADFLEEQGETDRAEFIRVQCEIASMTCGDGSVQEQRELIAREEELLGEGWPNWIGPAIWCVVPDGSHIDDTVRFRRGFVHSITIRAEDWLQYGDAILEQQPVQEVTLTTPLSILFGPVNFAF